MFVQPVLVYEADPAALRRAYERAMSRDVRPAVYTRELFETNHDEANRAAVASVPADELDLVGIAFRPNARSWTRSSTACASTRDRPPTVGIVSPGAMGSAVGAALARGGARVVATLAGRSERTRRLAERRRHRAPADARSVVREADVVLSIAPPEAARAIAADIAGAARARRRSPRRRPERRRARDRPAIAHELSHGGLDLVDGSISGPPPWKPGRLASTSRARAPRGRRPADRGRRANRRRRRGRHRVGREDEHGVGLQGHVRAPRSRLCSRRRRTASSSTCSTTFAPGRPSSSRTSSGDSRARRRSRLATSARCARSPRPRTLPASRPRSSRRWPRCSRPAAERRSARSAR